MSVRPAAVANLFYPAEASELRGYIHAALHDAAAQLPESLAQAKAMIVPHAGYIYSGTTAAFAYAALQTGKADIHRVVLLGPAHRVAFDGIALSGKDAFATPLGLVPLDKLGREQILNLTPEAQINDAAHAQEHGLEVQLPFLQMVLGEFSLLPVCLGMVPPERVSCMMESLWDDPHSLFVISSDLSHFHSYDAACNIDQHSITTVLQMQSPLNHEQACGATGINALLPIARNKHLRPKLLDYRNSGDTAGDKDRVVGYAAVVFSPEHG